MSRTTRAVVLSKFPGIFLVRFHGGRVFQDVTDRHVFIAYL